jgi:hypothetical protein
MATARLGHADLLLRDPDVVWRAIDLTGQSPLPGYWQLPRLPHIRVAIDFAIH